MVDVATATPSGSEMSYPPEVPKLRVARAPEAQFGPTPQALAFQHAWQQHISPKLAKLFGRLATEPEAVNLALAQVRGGSGWVRIPLLRVLGWPCSERLVSA